MGAFMYPIKIDRNNLTVDATFEKELDHQGPLTVAMLQEIAGNFPFEVEKDDYNCYVVTVYATRLETDAERDKRIAELEAYMVKHYEWKAKWDARKKK